MIHSKANVKAPNGTELKQMRDLQYSWPVFSDDYLINLSEEQKRFLYLEKNKRGFCIRLKIDSERNIEPAGDGPEWVPRWLEIKKEVDKHINSKIDETQQENI